MLPGVRYLAQKVEQPLGKPRKGYAKCVQCINYHYRSGDSPACSNSPPARLGISRIKVQEFMWWRFGDMWFDLCHGTPRPPNDLDGIDHGPAALQGPVAWDKLVL